MGRCIVAGGNPDMAAPDTGILASDLAVGSTVKLMENGVATEYLVVNQGKPSGSSLYDDSCDGLWLLRKDSHSDRQWHTSDVNKYESSAINTWLNVDFFNSLGSVEQAAIKQVKIPYCVGNGDATINSGANGLPAKVFLLCGYELNWSTSDIDIFPIIGACLSYFEGTAMLDKKRIAYLDGTAKGWWLRGNSVINKISANLCASTGVFSNMAASSSNTVRPALVLPSNAVFDTETLILKGVA